MITLHMNQGCRKTFLPNRFCSVLYTPAAGAIWFLTEADQTHSRQQMGKELFRFDNTQNISRWNAPPTGVINHEWEPFS